MARIPEAEIERIKREAAVERLAAARGVELARRGADLIGRCPFHADRTPSLVITPGKNLWHCLGACQAGGGPIDWVMRAEGVSFRHAAELLLREHAPAGDGKEQARRLESPVRAEAGDAEALAQVARFYHEALLRAPEARAYLAKRGLEDEGLIGRFELGFANRTLAYALPGAKWKAGGELRGRLQRLGILRESGHEHFNGSLVVPIQGAGGVVGMYGRKITPRLRAGTPEHLYLPGPHRGVWNEAGLGEGGGEVILCEALLDAMAFWCAGFRNVTASYGVNGFTADHRAAFQNHNVRRVYLAYDRDQAGDGAAAALARELMAGGIECLRVGFPRGMDANEYALKVRPAGKSLGLLVARAEWIGKPGIGHGPSAISSSAAPVAAAPAAAPPAPGNPEPAVPQDKAAQPAPAPAGDPHRGSPESLARQGEDDEWIWQAGPRRWRARGLVRNAAPDALKVNLMLMSPGGLHVDALDLYAARQRQAFARLAAEETGAGEEAIRRELATLVRLLEEARERAATATGNETIEVSSREVAQKAAEDFVGEDATTMEQHFGNRAGQTIGKQSADGARNFRDDGDHFNLVNKATGGNLHVRFPGGQ